MKKDKEWLIKRVENYIPLNDKTVGHVVDNILDIIRQLDEPEVLSPEWVDDNSIYASHDGITEEYVHVDDLKELLMPKQELPVIPKFVADWIEEMKQDERPLYSAMSSLLNKTNHTWSVWKSANKNFSEIMAQAWLNGYTVEKEQKYYVLIKGHEMITDDTHRYWNLDSDGVFLSDRHPVYGWKVTKMSKSEWIKFGINDSNADFVEVEEVEE